MKEEKHAKLYDPSMFFSLLLSICPIRSLKSSSKTWISIGSFYQKKNPEFHQSYWRNQDRQLLKVNSNFRPLSLDAYIKEFINAYKGEHIIKYSTMMESGIWTRMRCLLLHDFWGIQGSEFKLLPCTIENVLLSF